jgi:hypothetical protein
LSNRSRRLGGAKRNPTQKTGDRPAFYKEQALRFGVGFRICCTQPTGGLTSGEAEGAEVARLLFDAAGEAIADECTQIIGQVIGNAVVGGGAFGAPGKNASLEHHFEVLGYVGLAGFGRLYKILNTFFTIFEQVQNAEAHGFTQDTEVSGQILTIS